MFGKGNLKMPGKGNLMSERWGLIFEEGGGSDVGGGGLMFEGGDLDEWRKSDYCYASRGGDE